MKWVVSFRRAVLVVFKSKREENLIKKHKVTGHFYENVGFTKDFPQFNWELLENFCIDSKGIFIQITTLESAISVQVSEPEYKAVMVLSALDKYSFSTET